MTEGIRAFSFTGNTTGLLLIHGFFGTPGEMRPMGRFLADQGYTVEGTLLARHNGPPAGHYGVRWNEWVDSAEQSLQYLRGTCTRTILVGYSLGALVACHLAARYPIAGLILLAPALKLHNQLLFHLAGVAQYGVPWLYPFWRADWNDPSIQARVREFLPDVDFADLALRERLRRDTRIPTGALYELVRFQQIIKRNLWRLQIPLLVLQGCRDQTVMPIAAEIAIAQIGSTDKTLHWFERSGHMLPNGVEHERVWSTAADWIAQRLSADSTNTG